MKYRINTYYLLAVLFIFFNLKVFSGNEWENKTPDDCENYISVQGSSNINRFEFHNEQIKLEDNSNDSKTTDRVESIYVPVDKFSTSNKMMLKDFLKLVKADECPFIKIEVQLKSFENQGDTITGDSLASKISLAGNTQEYFIPCKYIYCDSSKVLIEGILKIRLTDFGLEPPKKVLGAIKVNDEVFITFGFTQRINVNLKKT